MPDENMTININSDVKNAETGINKINKKFGEMGKVVGNFALGAAAAIGSFAVGLGIKAVDSAKQLDSAVKNLGNQVGAGAQEMKDYEKIITDLYKLNIGENFQDVADMIAEVRKQTQLSGDALKTFTGYAAKFGKVYDAEIVETTRSANMLMNQFGLESEEAFNLMVQGMEQGLNKNDDFLDSINEYSVHFKNLGFDAEEMFNLYIKGAESGAFSIDKLGDAVKEFSLRSKDSSDSTRKAFKDLGFDADKTMKIFAEGGEEANTTFEDVLKSLGKIQNKIKRDEIGVALFGTMWEDLGADVVLSLGDVQDSFDKTVDSADGLNDVQYKDVDSMLSTLGRTLEVELLLPIGQELMPLIMELLDSTGEQLPGIIDQFKEWGGTIKKFFEDRGGFKNTSKQFWTDIWGMDSFYEKVNELKTELNNIKKIFTDAFGTMGRNAAEKLGGTIAAAYTWGRSLVQSFLSGMFSMFTSIAYVARNAAAIIRSYLGWYSPTERGPGRDSDEWGPNFVNMFTKGISMELPSLEQTASMGASNIESGFSQNIAKPQGGGGNVQLINANIYNETLLNMLMSRIKRELVVGGI
jgi:phage-related minor tail protein